MTRDRIELDLHRLELRFADIRLRGLAPGSAPELDGLVRRPAVEARGEREVAAQSQRRRRRDELSAWVNDIPKGWVSAGRSGSEAPGGCAGWN